MVASSAASVVRPEGEKVTGWRITGSRLRTG
jgi:hypothetical protein